MNAFLGGYLLIWGSFGALAFVQDIAIHRAVDHNLWLATHTFVIGGTALAGGSGTVIGALFGALVLAELKNGFNLIGISANPFTIILGLAILVSMILNVYLAGLRRAGRT